MSDPMVNTRREHQAGPTWAASAFVVEAVLLLAFIVASSAVFVQLFSAASVRSDEGGTTAAVVAAASTMAERFAANPMSVQEVTPIDDFVVVCGTHSDKRAGGTMYYADIAVYKNGSEPAGTSAGASANASAESATSDQGAIYSISTSAYVSEVSG